MKSSRPFVHENIRLDLRLATQNAWSLLASLEMINQTDATGLFVDPSSIPITPRVRSDWPRKTILTTLVSISLMLRQTSASLFSLLYLLPNLRGLLCRVKLYMATMQQLRRTRWRRISRLSGPCRLRYPIERQFYVTSRRKFLNPRHGF